MRSTSTGKVFPDIETSLTRMLGIRYPVIMAPMFLVSNVAMVVEATRAGITGAIPALNYRTLAALKEALDSLEQHCQGAWGINLIVNKSNVKYRSQLEACLASGVHFFITSLGNPKETIRRAHEKDIKVFCDVVNVDHAKKVIDLGADALIAVNSMAGGHAGPYPPEILIPQLNSLSDVPVISAGGVGNGAGLNKMLELGAAGISMGSPFIASEESPVSEDYKQAVVQFGAEDIVMTDRLSGTPCTVINTPYVEKMGTKQNIIEKFLNRNRRLKKWAKMLTFYRGTRLLREAAFKATYKTMWCAGPSIAHVQGIRPVQQIVKELIGGFYEENT